MLMYCELTNWIIERQSSVASCNSSNFASFCCIEAFCWVEFFLKSSFYWDYWQLGFSCPTRWVDIFGGCWLDFNVLTFQCCNAGVCCRFQALIVKWSLNEHTEWSNVNCKTLQSSISSEVGGYHRLHCV